MWSSRRSMNGRDKRNLFLKWLMYLLVLSIIFVYSTTKLTGFPKPLLFIPVALSISMREREMPAVGIGLLAGFLMDVAGDKLFGFNAFLMSVACLTTSLLFLHLLRPNAVNLTLIAAGITLIQGALDFLFFFAIWRQPDLGFIFVNIFIPSIVATILCSLPVYFLVKLIYVLMEPKEDHHIEEKSENIVRE